MSGNKRKLTEDLERQNGKRSRRGNGGIGVKSGQNLLRNDGAGGPGIFLTCVRGREKKAALELIDCLDELVEVLYPGIKLVGHDKTATSGAVELDKFRDEAASVVISAQSSKDEEKHPEILSDQGSNEAKERDDIEEQIRAELQEVGAQSSSDVSVRHSRSKPDNGAVKATWFDIVQTGTDCLTFIAVARPLCAVRLTYAFLDQVTLTGQTRCKFVQRLTPVVDVVRADAADLKNLARRVLAQNFPANDSFSYKVEPRLRSHDAMSKSDIIKIVLAAMPTAGDHKAELKGATHLIVVEVFKSVLGMSVLHSFEAYKRFNPQMIAEAKRTAVE